MSRPHVDDEWVVDTLAECLAGRPAYLSPDEDRVGWVTRRINQYIDRPWDEAGVAALCRQAKMQRGEGAVMRQAADILRHDLTAWRSILTDEQPGTMTHVATERMIADLETSIATLDARRGDLDHPGLVAKLSDGRRPPKPWALMAAGIAEELIRVLRDGGDSRAGVGGDHGPVAKFVRACLEKIMAPQTAPETPTISEAVGNHLKATLEYQRRGY
jgi:hypothetical protein